MTISSRAPVPGQQISVEEQRRLAVDGLKPAKVMHPQDADDAAGALRACDQGGAAVVVWGGGTHMRLGSPPRRYDVAFSTDRMTRLLEYEPADLTCRAEAGMRLSDLQDVLRQHGQRLPLDPPHPERATLGGMMAANSNGLTRARYGTVRDWVIGVAVAYPSGRVARAGGRVVKNVAGYDLMKLHTGALGTLGVIAEMNLKVQTLPERVSTIVGHFESAAQALAAGQALARGYLQPAAIAVLDRQALWSCGLTADWPWTLALRAEGYRQEVDAVATQAMAAVRKEGGRIEAPDLPGRFWESVRDFPVGDDAIVLSGMTSLAGLPALVEAATEVIVAHPASGALDVRVPLASAQRTLERMRAAAGHDGQVIVASAPPAAKPYLDVWGPPPPGLALMQGLKQALDPGGILNPGRFVGGI